MSGSHRSRRLSPPATLPPVGPHQRALAALWAETARRRLWAPPTFWRWWRLRRNMRLALLDPERVRVVGPAPPLAKVPDCANCLNNCCVGAHATVLLRLRDIAALLDAGREDLITHDRPTFSAALLASRPALARQVSAPSWRTFPVLAKGPLGACRALDDAGRCGVHPWRPLSCARFPWSLDVEAEEVFFSPRCPSFWVRPDRQESLRGMRAAAVAAYNARIQDAILLRFAARRLGAMPLARYLAPGALGEAGQWVTSHTSASASSSRQGSSAAEGRGADHTG